MHKSASDVKLTVINISDAIMTPDADERVASIRLDRPSSLCAARAHDVTTQHHVVVVVVDSPLVVADLEPRLSRAKCFAFRYSAALAPAHSLTHSLTQLSC